MKYVFIGIVVFWYVVISFLTSASAQPVAGQIVLGDPPYYGLLPYVDTPEFVESRIVLNQFHDDFKMVYRVGDIGTRVIPRVELRAVIDKHNAGTLSGSVLSIRKGTAITREAFRVERYLKYGNGPSIGQEFLYEVVYTPNRKQLCDLYGGVSEPFDSLTQRVTQHHIWLKNVPLNSSGLLGYDQSIGDPVSTALSYCYFGAEYGVNGNIISWTSRVPIVAEVNGVLHPDPPPPNDPMCSGYIPSTDTFKAVMSETKAKIEATPIATLARLTINLSPPPCPVWKVPDVLGFGGFEINVQCSSIMTSYIYPMMKLTIFMAAGMASARMSIL